ncbi:hypothetical protein [Lactococcus lactis]|uniref:hypothetical protein n=1 Tax=Lactococcus lactis TaxID=1358 RepID=UPI00288E41F2|nr:hypothetical protein [Lactococcus lactis]MDT2887944.1 hypothetical protein [Lactococcus lactis]MDT2930724.1 hypothetical protein [Lactococcus lactis]
MEKQVNENLNQALDDLQQSKALNSQQAQQISELLNRYSNLEKMHNEALQKLEELSKVGPLSKEVKTTVKETTSVSKQSQQRMTDFVNRLIKTSKLKSQTALRISMKTMRVDSLLTSLSTGLKHFAEKLGQLEQKIQALGVEQQPKIETEQKNNIEKTPEPEGVVRPRVRLGERRPEVQPPKPKTTKKESLKQEKPVKSQKTVTPEAELTKESPQPSASVLPEDFRPILERSSLSIDAAHESQDELGNPTYGYRANQKIDVPGVPLESIKGLSSIKISDLLKKDLVDRLMDGRLSVDQVFTEAQQTQMVAAYSNQKKQPNAFEKRVSKAEVEKKAQKATISQSQEVIQDKHRSR